MHQQNVVNEMTDSSATTTMPRMMAVWAFDLGWRVEWRVGAISVGAQKRGLDGIDVEWIFGRFVRRARRCGYF